jgi:hypothetical protein
METMNRIDLTIEQLAHLGGGEVGYIREMGGAAASKLLGPKLAVPADAKLFCLFAANGAPMSISGNLSAALASAAENEIKPVSVH